MNGGEIAGLITAVVGLLGAGGTGIKFLWDKIEKRFTHIEGELEKCREREEKTKDHRAIHLTVIELIWAELRRFDPQSLVLVRAKELLDDLKEKNRLDHD